MWYFSWLICYKLNLDQYYTPDDVAKRCTKRAIEVIGLGNISEFFEPSAGTGAFLRALKDYDKPVKATDLEPKCEGIVQADFLEETDWAKERRSVSCKKVQKAVIVKVLKRNGIN